MNVDSMCKGNDVFSRKGPGCLCEPQIESSSVNTVICCRLICAPFLSGKSFTAFRLHLQTVYNRRVFALAIQNVIYFVEKCVPEVVESI